MKKAARSNQEIEAAVKSAGQNFLAMRMADLLNRIPELEDRELKKKLIQEYYEKQIGTYDKTMAGTGTRVNAAIRIINGEKVIDVLRMIDGSNPRVLSEAVDKAKETIRKIESGEILLPELK